MGFLRIWESISPVRRQCRRATQPPPALDLKTAQRLMNQFGATEHVGNDVGAMQPGEHALAVTDPTMNERHVMNLIEWSQKSIARQRADLGFDGKLADTLDQFVAGLPVGDKFGDGDALQLLPLRELGKLGAPH